MPSLWWMLRQQDGDKKKKKKMLYQETSGSPALFAVNGLKSKTQLSFPRQKWRH
jgi:hypothetical protein